MNFPSFFGTVIISFQVEIVIRILVCMYCIDMKSRRSMKTYLFLVQLHENTSLTSTYIKIISCQNAYKFIEPWSYILYVYAYKFFWSKCLQLFFYLFIYGKCLQLFYMFVMVYFVKQISSACKIANVKFYLSDGIRPRWKQHPPLKYE
jgi:hypothetical protein